MLPGMTNLPGERRTRAAAVRFAGKIGARVPISEAAAAKMTLY
jgi:hypothetical protein